MKWVAISGSWRKIDKEIEEKVRKVVREIISRGDGIVTGGALGIDYIATDEALKSDPSAKSIKIFLPATLEIFLAHYRKRAKEGVITEKQAEDLISQLNKIRKINPSAIVENHNNKVINEEAYHERNSNIIEAADELIAFWVNQTPGTKDAIDKARQKDIPVKVFSYNIE